MDINKSFMQKPSWVLQPLALHEALDHSSFLPSNITDFVNLPDVSSFLQGVKQQLYWKGELASSISENTVIISLLGPKGLIRPNVINVSKALKSVCNLGQLVEVYQHANSNFLGFTFKVNMEINKIIKNFLFFEDAVVLCISYASSNTHRFRLMWLPPMFDLSRVHHLLASITSSYKFKKESLRIGEAEYSPTNSVSGTLTPKEGKTVVDLPHLIKLPSPHKGCALLSITSRDPLCLKCREVGHLRKDCGLNKCIKCSKVHFITSPCGVSSYSSVAAKNVTKCADDVWLSSVTDDGGSDVEESTVALSSSPSDNSLVVLANCDRTKHVLAGDIGKDGEFLPSLKVPVTNRKPNLLPVELKVSVNASLDPFDNDFPVSTTKKDGESQPVAVKLQPASPPVTRSQASNKIRVLSKIPVQTDSLRSGMITYTKHNSGRGRFESLLTKHHLSQPSSFIFGDPYALDCFSSNSDDSGEEEIFAEQSASASTSKQGRKRKGPPDDSLIVSPIPLIDPLIDICGDPTVLNSGCDSVSRVEVETAGSTDLQVDLVDVVYQLSDMERQVIELFGISTDQIMTLRKLCPDETVSAGVFRQLKLLNSYGIPMFRVIESPQVLKLRSSVLSKRLKYLMKHLATVTLEDVFHWSEIEGSINAGKDPYSYRSLLDCSALDHPPDTT